MITRQRKKIRILLNQIASRIITCISLALLTLSLHTLFFTFLFYFAFLLFNHLLPEECSLNCRCSLQVRFENVFPHMSHQNAASSTGGGGGGEERKSKRARERERARERA